MEVRWAHNPEVAGSSPVSATYYVGCSSMVEQRIVAPHMGVRFSSVTPLGLTQLGECYPYKLEVVGSNPTSEIKTHTANSSHEDCRFKSYKTRLGFLAQLADAIDLKSIFKRECLVKCL